MKKYLALAGIILATLLFGQFFTTPTEAKEEKFRRTVNRVPGRYIVVFNDGMIQRNTFGPSYKVDADSYELAGDYAANVDHVYNSSVNGFSAQMTETSAKALSRDPRVKYVEEDGVVTVAAEQAGATWGLDRIDQRSLPLNSSFQYSTTGSGVHAYVIDSGVRVSHQEFGGRAINSVDLTNDGQNGNDCNGHGTHVAGTIGGATVGVAKGATIHSVRVVRCDGTGYLSDVLAGVNWVTANRITPAVANISLIFGGASPTLDNAISASIASGVTYTIAAGNYNNNSCNYSPARTPNALTVGATMNTDVRPVYSNQGPCLDLYAPGHSITSLSHGDDVSYRSMSGTSMAAPHVAGVAALYLESHPNASAAEVSQEILNNATVGVVTNVDGVSANRMLHYQSNGAPPPPPPSSVTIVKQVQTATGGTASVTSFGYTASNLGTSNFSLVDNDNPPADRYVNPDVRTVESSNEIVVTENAVSGWGLNSIQCVETAGGGMANLQNSVVDVTNRKVTIRVEQGESVTCTFTSAEVLQAVPATVSGRVTSKTGRGLAGVSLSLRNTVTGATLSATTNSFGYYTIRNAMTTHTYSLSPRDKKYRFTPGSQVFTLNGSMDGVNFVGN